MKQRIQNIFYLLLLTVIFSGFKRDAKCSFNICQNKDSIFYLIKDIKVSQGFLYSYIPSKNSDSEPKAFKFLTRLEISTLHNGSVNLSDEGNFIVLFGNDLNRLKKNIKNNFVLQDMTSKNFMNNLGLVKKKVFNNGDALYLFSFTANFRMAFIDVEIYKELFWTPKQIKFPPTGYIKILIPTE